MKRIALLLAVLAAQALGQSPSADSLQSVLRQRSGAARIPVLLALVGAIETKSPLQAIQLADEGVRLAVKAGDKESEAAFLSSTAFCYSLRGDFALALKFANETLALSRAIGNQDRMAKAYSTLGATNTFLGLYSRALENHLDALRIREELHLESASLQSMNAIGILYHRIGQYDTAIEYYQRILTRAAARPDTARMVILAKINMGFSEYKRGQYAEAMRVSNEALASALRANNGTAAYAHFVLGSIATDVGRYGEAGDALRQSLAEYAALEQKHGRVQVLNALGRLAVLEARPARAIPFLREAAELSQQIKSRDELKTSYELLARVYDQQGNTAEAFRYFRNFVAIRDSIFNTQESDKLAGISMKIVTLQKDNEIESLKRDNVIADLKLQRQRFSTVILVVILASLAVIVAMLSWYSRRLQHGSAMLEAKNDELGRLNGELNERIHEIKTLSGLLPICAWCKNIRDDQGYWQQLEGYIGERTAAQFSHGICPACAAKMEREG